MCVCVREGREVKSAARRCEEMARHSFFRTPQCHKVAGQLGGSCNLNLVAAMAAFLRKLERCTKLPKYCPLR